MTAPRILSIVLMTLGIAGCAGQGDLCERTCRALNDCGETVNVQECVLSCTIDLNERGLDERLDSVEDCAVYHLYNGECAPESYEVCLDEIDARDAENHAWDAVQEVCDLMRSCCPDENFRTYQRKCDSLGRSNKRSDLSLAVEQGLIGYDPAAADVCMTEIQEAVGNQTCDSPVEFDGSTIIWTLTPTCASVYTGLVQEGGSCMVSDGFSDYTVTEACAEGLTCSAQSDGTATCEQVSPESVTCQYDAQCSLGHTCDVGSETCVELGSPGDSCLESSDCRQGQCNDGVCVNTDVCTVW